LSALPAMAVPPAKGLDEAFVWFRKAALTPFPPVTKSEQDYCHGRNKTWTRAKLLNLNTGSGKNIRGVESNDGNPLKTGAGAVS
jgi:hypothetical protein